MQIIPFNSIATRLVFVFLLLGCIPIYGCVEEERLDSQINKEVSRIVALLPTKRQVGHGRQIVNDLRLAMVYNQGFSDKDDRMLLRSAKGVILFIIVEKYGEKAKLYYSIIGTYQKSLRLMESIRSFEDFEKKLFFVGQLKRKELILLTKNRLTISLVPDSGSKIGAPWGMLAFCGIGGDVTSIKFGKGEWSDDSVPGISCPDAIADNLFQILEQLM